MQLFAQKVVCKGFVFDQNQKIISGASVSINEVATKTNEKGFYTFSIEQKNNSEIVFFKEGYSVYVKNIEQSNLKEIVLNVILIKEKIESLDTIKITKKKKKYKPTQSIEISPEILNKLPTLSGGIEDILKTLPGVNSNSELSSKYAVRGGNFDENLVYIDNLELTFPNLIRNGQQEGLSLINRSLVDNIYFSAGGFESSYGDKMSSVLSVNYKKPIKNDFSLEASLLGVQATSGFLSPNKKFSFLGGLRYFDKTLVLNTFSEETEFNPQYFDVQTKLTYQFNPKWDVSYISTFANNKININPQSKTVNFGTSLNPIQLKLNYNGQERDKYKTFFNAFTLSHRPNARLNLDLSFFYTHMEETESFDIQSFYVFNAADITSNSLALDVGSQQDYARNDLITKVYGLQLNGEYGFKNNNKIKWGAKYQQEHLQDRLNEWQLISDGGYNFPSDYDNYPPGQVTNSDLTLNYAVNSRANLFSNRISGYTQYTKQWNLENGNLSFSGGFRGTYWDLNNEFNLSPRTQITYKPKSERNTEFRFATGLYYQPPFYRELRNLQGELNTTTQSQRSLHFILGNNYSFYLKKNKVNLTTELYYKKLDNLIPYYLDNVRIRYTANNNSNGFAYGVDTRFSTEFTKGLESWLSLSYARTLENIENKGLISRPTDQRFRASVLFQDYMPQFPSFKVILNLVYASGLPNGAPLFTDPYLYQSNLPDYKRVDISLVKIFKDKNTTSKIVAFKKLSEFTFGIEVFNLFDIRNTISNQSLLDISSNRLYFVPYSLSGRFFNLKLTAKI